MPRAIQAGNGEILTKEEEEKLAAGRARREGERMANVLPSQQCDLQYHQCQKFIAVPSDSKRSIECQICKRKFLNRKV